MSEIKLISSEDREKIKEAVRQAELKTSGEIVPFFTVKSDDYPEAIWKASVLAGLAGLMGGILQDVSGGWMPFSVSLTLAGLTVLGALVGYLASLFLFSFRRFVAGEALLDRRVRQKALEAFLYHEVFRTRDRTGILLFLSEKERRVLVLGDSGISAKVAETEWKSIVDGVTRRIKEGDPARGIIEAIHACGELLEKHGVARRKDDRDELGNELRTD